MVTLVDVVYQLVNNGRPAISRFGLGFLWNTRWAPNFSIEGAGALIYGTAVSSLIALVLATPLGIAIGLYLSMMAPARVRAVVGPLVEMLAAVPSIIYGFWGLVVLVPFINGLEPGLHSALGFIPLFGPASTTGISVMSAGIVLTVMILPIISALSRDLFLTVPAELKDGAEALGATRWELIRGIVLPSTASGVGAAVVLGLGRALGEAIAVSFVIGDVSTIHASLFEPGSAIAERIAISVPVSRESPADGRDVLCRTRPGRDLAAHEPRGPHDRRPVRRGDAGQGDMSAATPITLGETGLFDPAAPLTPSGNLRRRAVVDRFVQVVATAAALAAVAVLVIVVYGVAARGASALSLGFVVHNSQGLAGGGIANALLGTLEIVAAAAVIAVPLGILTGLYLTEFAGARSRTARMLKLALDMMQGLPTIVVGLFVYGLIVIPTAPGVGLRRRRRTVDRDAPADGAGQPGGAVAGPGQPARGRGRARREPLAHRAHGDPPGRNRRARHRRDPGHRARRRRDRAALDLRLDL